MRKLEVEAAKFAQAGLKQRGSAEESAAGALQQAAAKESAQRLIVDMQEMAQHLSKSKKDRAEIERLVTVQKDKEQQSPMEALAVPTGHPLTIFDPTSFPAAYTEFLFGDCVPFLKRATPVTAQQVFDALPNREELEYALEGDTSPYRASDRSRWDTPEFYLVFASFLRALKLCQSVKASMDRPGFVKDFRVVANKRLTKDFLEAALHPSMPRTNQDLLSTAGNERIQIALRHLAFSTATVPLTDGNKMRLHHFGCAMNHVFGALTVFHTHNYADNYSPEILKMQSSELPEDAVVGAFRENIVMPTLQQMHVKTAASPRSTARLFLLMEELSYRHLYGVDSAALGNFRINPNTSFLDREDDFASSGSRGVADFPKAVFKCIEAQARGFAHGHGKVHSIPDATEGLFQCLEDAMPEISQELEKAAVGRGHDACGSERSAGERPAKEDGAEEGKGIASDVVRNVDAIVERRTKAYNEALLGSACTRQYESSILPAKQFGNSLPDAPFSEKQQRQSRYDGLLEADGITRRRLVRPKSPEPPAHIERDRNRAAFEHQLPRNAYKEVPLTGCQLCIAPHYLLP
ncbi:MAG: hypothetical protein L7S71_02540, partial [Pseudomonadales bacterium]|nr:hypothetical protein [Pseudomonadales bacterium]